MSKIPNKTLNNGITIPAIGSCSFSQSNNIEEADRFTYQALKAGYRFLDTSDGWGNEQGVVRAAVRWLNENEGKQRSDLYYSTRISEAYKDGYEAVKKAIDQSLKIAEPLGYIDLLFVGAPLTSKQNRLEAWKAFQEAVEAGKVKSIGVANYGPRHVEELLSWDGLKIKPVINLLEFNPWLCRTELAEYCRSNDIQLESYAPTMKGKGDSQPEIVKLTKKYNKDPGQILLRWHIQAGFVVIPETPDFEKVALYFDIFDFELTKEEMDELTHPNDHWVTASWDPANSEYNG